MLNRKKGTKTQDVYLGTIYIKVKIVRDYIVERLGGGEIAELIQIFTLLIVILQWKRFYDNFIISLMKCFMKAT